MPRKPLLYTDEHPYHIVARSNNKEWFYVSMSECWRIFSEGLNHIQEHYGFSVHLFVLMNNHYHLVGQCSQKHNLGEVMAWLQKFVSRKINGRTGRINHVFGGAYKACLINNPRHYSIVFKYVARNPVTAKVSENVFSYKYSTLFPHPSLIKTTVSKEWSSDILEIRNWKEWLNTDFPDKEYFQINGALKKTVFKMRDRETRRSL